MSPAFDVSNLRAQDLWPGDAINLADVPFHFPAVYDKTMGEWTAFTLVGQDLEMKWRASPPSLRLRGWRFVYDIDSPETPESEYLREHLATTFVLLRVADDAPSELVEQSYLYVALNAFELVPTQRAHPDDQ